jgi:RNA polymerase sigma-70 factor (ECF subfamily)
MDVQMQSTDGPLADEQVIARVLRGDGDAFEAILRRYDRRLYRTARAILRDDVEAEDAMQEAYVRAYEHLGGFEGRARFSTWLTRIVVHETLGRLRRRERAEPVGLVGDLREELMADLSSAGADPERAALDRELGAFLEQAIDELPQGIREVFVLRAVEELSVAETAACLDVPEDTVKTRLFRARGHLQRRLAERADSAIPELFPFHAPRCNRVVAAVLERVGGDRR